MFPIQSKGRQRNVTVKPFPSNVSATAYFTGLDVEIFEPASIKTLYAEGCYGMNPKPRQVRESLANFSDESAAGSHSLVLFPEEALFLHQHVNSLEIRDLDDKPIQTERLWKIFFNLKESFVECYIAYLYLKSKNWVIKSGIKFGGDYRKLSHDLFTGHSLIIQISSALQTRTSVSSCLVSRHCL